jgi:hypothetical protein
MLKLDVIKLSKKGCSKKHPVRDASLGRTVNIALFCILLGMHPYGIPRQEIFNSRKSMYPVINLINN